MDSTTLAGAAAVSPWLPQPVRIARKKQEATGICTYDLELETPDVAAAYRFAPGQFNMLYLPGFGEAAISISSSPSQPQAVSHTVRHVGNVTGALARMNVGDSLLLRGPFGSAWPVEACTGCDVVIACGGVGLAPLRPVIYHIIEHRPNYGRVHLLYGARTPKDLLYTSEYDAWRDAGVEVDVTVDLGDHHWQGHIGVVPMLFYRLRLDDARTRVLTCGPEIMMRFAIFEALARKIPAHHVYLSMERKMSCAMGLCGQCQLGPSFVCKDGPVFTYEQMQPYLHLEDL
ncbi:MAG: FAD/NAD(P)-binding protein [Planctomycetales bacterium]|nr:FAD/NAD(P)-binding protein [Planctomycetales bacterium]